MEKEVKLFDKRFVHFMWDDSLEGKEVFLADSMEDLIFAVENDGKCAVKTNVLRYNGNNVKPFHAYMLGANSYTFAYYDPNYEVKKAFNEGKKIQVHCANGTWINCDEPKWYDDCAYRVKPEKQYRSYKSSAEMIDDYLERFNISCPSYAEPSIWVKRKNNNALIKRSLITAFFSDSVIKDAISYSLEELFDDYTYLDGSPCGMEAKK